MNFELKFRKENHITKISKLLIKTTQKVAKPYNILSLFYKRVFDWSEHGMDSIAAVDFGNLSRSSAFALRWVCLHRMDHCRSQYSSHLKNTSNTWWHTLKTSIIFLLFVWYTNERNNFFFLVEFIKSNWNFYSHSWKVTAIITITKIVIKNPLRAISFKFPSYLFI